MSLGVTTFDELNKLVGMNRSEPFQQFFAPMHLTARQKNERVRLAEKFEDEFRYFLAYMFYSYPNINVGMVKELQDGYIRQLEELGIAVGVATGIAEKQVRLRMQAEKFAIDTVEATQRHKDEPYYFSNDRARLLAEDQANWAYDIIDYEDALIMGARYKTWNTVGDNHVRDSHAEVEGLTIPIEEPFVLMGGLLNHPHDSSLGCSDSELAGCRCSLSFNYGE